MPYDPGVPLTLQPYPERTLLDYLADLAAQQPTRPALLFQGASISYARLDAESTAFAAALTGLGVAKGDRVALLLPNCPQLVIAQFGIWKAGAIAAPLNPTYTDRELEDALERMRARTIVTLTAFHARVKRVQGRAGVEHVIATSIKEYLPPLLRLLFTAFRERKGGHHVRLAPGDLWLQTLLQHHRRSPRPAVTVGPQDAAVLLSSGGTTGTPKGVVGRHQSFVMAGMQIDVWTRAVRHAWCDAIMLPLPLFHVYANVGVLSVALIGPNPLSLIPNPRDIDDLLKAIRQVRPAFFAGVPTLFAAMLHHRAVRTGRIDLRCIKLCFSGAAPLLAEMKQEFERLTGARLVEGYSLTEGMMACCLNPVLGTQKIGSIGLPLPDVEIRLVDADEGTREVAPGEVGEMILRAPQVMQGYWNNPMETADALRPHGDGGPWLHTGDLARIDGDGYVFLVDRKKDLVKTSGFQVWPREVEEVIAAHPAVREVGVAGVPHPVKGEVPKAWVVLREGHEVTAHDLREYCRERLAPYKIPAAFEFRADLPKTMVGKVLRRVLAAESRDPERPPTIRTRM